MKSRIFWMVAMTALMWMNPLSSAPGGGGGGGGGAGGGGAGGMGRKSSASAHVSTAQPPKDSLRQLRQFADLSDAQLIAIRDVIDSLLAMSPEERDSLRNKIAEYAQLDPETQVMMRQGWGHLSREDQDNWRDMMQSLSEKERESIHDALQRLPHAERMQHRLSLLEKWKQQQKH